MPSATGPSWSPASAPTTPTPRSGWPSRRRRSAPTAYCSSRRTTTSPARAGILHHFRQVVDAAELPVMLYDVPGRTGSQIAVESYEEMAGWEPVVAVKDAVGDFARGVRIKEMGYARLLRRRRRQPGAGWRTARSASCRSPATSSVTGCAPCTTPSTTATRWPRSTSTPACSPPSTRSWAPRTTAPPRPRPSLEMIGVLENRRVRSPLIELDDTELAALRAGLDAAGVLSA